MRRFIPLVLLFLVLPLFAWATEPLSADAFERYTTGKTLTFARKDGEIYGSEQYFQNRRVLWAPRDGACKEGKWYAKDVQICFVYDGDSDPQCWSFFAQEGGLSARYRNDPAATELYEVKTAPTPFACPVPWLGS